MYYLELAQANLKSERYINPTILLTPHPQICLIQPGALDLNANIIFHTNLPPEYHHIINKLQDEIKVHIDHPIPSKIIQLPEVEPCLLFQSEINSLPNQAKSNFTNQGYTMVCDPATQILSIWAHTPVGIFYAIQTLFQILNNSPIKEAILPKMQILDYPILSLRGISDDISRGQAATVLGIKRFIVELSRFKLNYYFFYIEDIIRIQKHPQIGEGRGALTKAQVADLVTFAQQYFVTLVPIFESLGHMDNILSLPEYVNLAEFPGSDCLNVSDPKIYELLDDIYSELAIMFPASEFHVGCDESGELGTYRSREYIESIGKGQSYLRHYSKIYELVKKYNKKDVFIYHDIASKFPEVLNGVPKDYIFIYWDYSPFKVKYPGLTKIAHAGFRTIVSPSVHDYNRFFPHMTQTEKNTTTLIQDGVANGSYGVIQSSWGDFRNENLRENRLYGFIMATAMGWNPLTFDLDSFWDAFFLHFFGTKNPQLRTMFTQIRTWTEGTLGRHANFNNLWAHPFAWPKITHNVNGYKNIFPQIDPILTRLEDFQLTVPRNHQCVDTLYFNFRLYRFLLRKMLNANIVNKSDITSISDSDRQKILEELKWLELECIELRRLFRQIWTITCSDANLPELLQQYSNMAGFYRSKQREILDKKPWSNPNLPSSWIYYCPQRKPHDQLNTYFRKLITPLKITQNSIPSRIQSVYLQVIGDTHVEVYINGKNIQEFFSKRTLSLRMLNQMVQIIDVTPYWTEEINSIVIHNMNYQGSLGLVNIYGEMTFEDGSMTPILSDETWDVSDAPSMQWISGQNPNVEKKSFVLEKPPFVNGSLSYPDLPRKIVSHHTYRLGIGSQATAHIPTLLLKFAPWLAKKAFKKGLIL